MKEELVVAIGDVGHTTKILSNNFVPINIGYMRAYILSQFPDHTKVVLFKDPEKLIEFIRTDRPDILAMSNYCWNAKLTHYIFRLYKSVCPQGATIIGGPNFPIDKNEVAQWMKMYPYVDFAVERESEVPSAHILARLLEADCDLLKAKSAPVAGSYCLSQAGELQHLFEPALREMDEIPSPYLNGSMDEFLIQDVKGFALIPLLETTRGCPFPCTFCTSGDQWYQKVRAFSDERVMKEIEYIAEILKKQDRKVSGVMITDLNFGSFARDAFIAEKLNETYRQFGWPQTVMATTGKTRGERVLGAVSKHPGLAMTMSVQSMDDDVLKLIKRKNFPTDQFLEYQKHLRAQGRLSKSDTIMALPGDTRDKHLETLRKLINLGIDVIDTFSYMMLKGTNDDLPQAREQYGFETKWRLLPGNFSVLDGEPVFETEEIVVATKTFDYEDYKYCRKIHLVLTTICNWTIFLEVKRLLVERNLDVIAFLQRVEAYLTSSEGPRNLSQLMDEFSRKVEAELFQTEEDLHDYYSHDSNYWSLREGQVGENLLQNYRFKMTLNICELTEAVIRVYCDFLEESGFDRDGQVEADLFALLRARAECIDGLLKGRFVTDASPVEFELDYDFVRWVQSNGEEGTIESFASGEPCRYIAYYNESQLKEFDIFLPKEQNMMDDEKARAVYRMGTTKMMPTFESDAKTLSGVNL